MVGSFTFTRMSQNYTSYDGDLCRKKDLLSAQDVPSVGSLSESGVLTRVQPSRTDTASDVTSAAARTSLQIFGGGRRGSSTYIAFCFLAAVESLPLILRHCSFLSAGGNSSGRVCRYQVRRCINQSDMLLLGAFFVLLFIEPLCHFEWNLEGN